MTNTFFGSLELEQEDVKVDEQGAKGETAKGGSEESAEAIAAKAKEDEDKAAADAEAKALEAKSKGTEPTEAELETRRIEQLANINAKDEKDRSKEEQEFLSEFGESTDTYEDIIKGLADDAIITVQEGKEYKGVEGFKEVVVDNIKLGIETYKGKFDDETKKFLKFLEDGGRREDYYEFLFEDKYSEVDENNTANHRPLVEDLYRLQGYSSEDIAEKIELLVDNDKLAKEAGIAKVKLSKMQESREQLKLKQQEQVAEQSRKQDVERIAKVEEAINTLDNIADFVVTKKDKEDLLAYITKPVKGGSTQYDIDKEKTENKIKLAFLQKKGFKFEDLERKSTNKAVNKLAKALDGLSSQNYKNASDNIKDDGTKDEPSGKPNVAWRFGKSN